MKAQKIAFATIDVTVLGGALANETDDIGSMDAIDWKELRVELSDALQMRSASWLAGAR